MKTVAMISLLALMACTVNVYDYSSHSGSGGGGGTLPPDTVYIEDEPEIDPDTLLSEYDLLGDGYVAIEKCGSWSRYVLFGCKTETDGAAFVMRPVMEVDTVRGLETRVFSLQFSCKLQSHLVEDSEESALLSGRSGVETVRTVLPVVTGTELVTIVSDRTSYPFLAEESDSYDGNWLPDGTLAYDAVFTVADWMFRDICTTERQLVVSSETPEFRMIFGDNERRLLHQFFDIFVVNNGEPALLPVGITRN